MPLQNRVTPFGDIVALPGRGLLMGNRGVLHDDLRRIVRPWQVRRWIVCLLDFRGRRHAVMRPRRYTELFFLDEAAAFAAGHRPCAECRNADYRRFKALWTMCYGAPHGVDEMDTRIHADRLEDRAVKRTYRGDLSSLPDGTYVTLDGTPWLVLDDSLLAWSDRGYTSRRARLADARVDVLTPKSLVAVLCAGYVPVLHPSVETLE